MGYHQTCLRKLLSKLVHHLQNCLTCHFKLEICFEWGTTGISIRPYTVFNIYINDLKDDISSKVLKFADDTNVFRKVTNDTDKHSLQDDLEKK